MCRGGKGGLGFFHLGSPNIEDRGDSSTLGAQGLKMGDSSVFGGGRLKMGTNGYQ